MPVNLAHGLRDDVLVEQVPAVGIVRMADSADLDRTKDIDDAAARHTQSLSERVTPGARRDITQYDDPFRDVAGAAGAHDALKDDRHRVEQIGLVPAQLRGMRLDRRLDVDVEQFETDCVEDLPRGSLGMARAQVRAGRPARVSDQSAKESGARPDVAIVVRGRPTDELRLAAGRARRPEDRFADRRWSGVIGCREQVLGQERRLAHLSEEIAVPAETIGGSSGGGLNRVGVWRLEARHTRSSNRANAALIGAKTSSSQSAGRLRGRTGVRLASTA